MCNENLIEIENYNNSASIRRALSPAKDFPYVKNCIIFVRSPNERRIIFYVTRILTDDEREALSVTATEIMADWPPNVIAEEYIQIIN